MVGLFAAQAQAQTIPSLPDDMTDNIYVYHATVVDVYDADTLTLDVDLGFHVQMRQKVRLFGIDAWEVRGSERPKGLVAKQRVIDILEGKTLLFRSIKDGSRITGKYGRYLAVLYVPNSEGTGFISINDLLVTEGHAEYVDY